MDRLELALGDAGLVGQQRGTAVVLGEDRDHLVGAVAGAVLDEPADLVVLRAADRLGQHPVGDVADQHVLERVLAARPRAGCPSTARRGPSPGATSARRSGRSPRRVPRRRASPPRTCDPRPPPAGRAGARAARASRAAPRAGPAPCRAARRPRTSRPRPAAAPSPRRRTGCRPRASPPRSAAFSASAPCGSSAVTSLRVSSGLSGSRKIDVAPRRPPPHAARCSSSSSRARQRSSSGPRTHCARYSIRSSIPWSAQWMSSKASTSGCWRARASIVARTAEKNASRSFCGSSPSSSEAASSGTSMPSSRATSAARRSIASRSSSSSSSSPHA